MVGNENWKSRNRRVTLLLVFAVLVVACSRGTEARYPENQGYGYMTSMGFVTAAMPVGAMPMQLSATPTQPGDPINNIDMPWLRGRGQEVFTEMREGLQPQPRARVEGIPLLVDDDPGVVNAFAACTSTGKAVIVISDGLYDIMAHLAQCKATDEKFGTNKTDEYIQYMAKNQKWGDPVIHPPESFWNPARKNNPDKIQRQHEIYDEEVGFILGHEMAHHYFGHLPCSAGNVTASEANVVIRSVAPGFNQINEVGADTGSTHNVLDAGVQQDGYHWTENGGVLVMTFFAGIRAFRPEDVVFSFESSHPPAALRIPIIQQAAQGWRMTRGAKTPVPIPAGIPWPF